MISIFLVEDHVVVRQGLRVLLERHHDFRVVGEASTVAEAIDADVAPDVIVADLVLPDGRGAEVVSHLRERYPEARVLVLSMVDNPADVQLTFAAGARGYLLKEAAASELTEAVRKVARGEDYLQPSLGVAMARWREMPPRPHVSAIEQLTEREREVLKLIALGHTNAAIASMMYVSVRTVESRRSRIMQKLNLQTRADLVRYAADAGLTPKG